MSHSAQPARDRYLAVDGLRFLAALGIVIHHYVLITDNAALRALFARNYLFVDFFFVISGFVIFHTYADKLTDVAAYGSFLKNRIARIYPLHLATFCVFLIFSFTIWRGRGDIDFVSPSAILPNLALVHAWDTTSRPTFNFPSWSISAEWFVYLLFPVVVWLARRGGAARLVIVALTVVALLEAARLAGLIEPWTTLTYHFGMLRAVPSFLAGAALARGAPAIPLRLTSFVPAWLLFAAAAGAMMAGIDDRLIVLLLAATVVAAVLAERDGARGLLTHRTMAHLGDLSYAIYMMHALVATFFIHLIAMKILHLAGTSLTLWVAACVFIPNMIVAAIVYRWFEAPARRFVRGLALPKFLSLASRQAGVPRRSW
jgi:peptidoglycan/LPS O-acetylase OafA/YrhL